MTGCCGPQPKLITRRGGDGRQLAVDEQNFSRLVDFLTAIVNVIPVAGGALDVSAP
jgi:hypothetical protein